MAIFNIVFIPTQKQLALSGMTRKAMLHLGTSIIFEYSSVFLSATEETVLFVFMECARRTEAAAAVMQTMWSTLVVKRNSRWSEEYVLRQNNISPV